MKTGYVLAGIILVIIATIPAGYAAWIWLEYSIIGFYTILVWETVITLVSVAGVLCAIGGVLLWKGRNDWLD